LRGGACLFDGKSFLSQGNIHFEDFTFSAFVKAPPTRATSTIAAFSSWLTGIVIARCRATHKARSDWMSPGTKEINDYETKLAPGVWTHVAVTYSKPTAKIYLNGKLAQSGELDADLKAATFYVGGDDHFNGRCWQGWIDEVAMFKSALTDSEIREIAEKTPKISNQSRLTISAFRLIRREGSTG